MNVKKILSILLVVAMMVSAVVLATAESTDTATTETVAADTAAEADAAPVYTLDEMLNMAMTDAYARQAAYAAYAEAYPDSRSITGADMDTQIVLLEMLLKANGAALPAYTQAVTVPETQTDAYSAIATAETDAVTMYRSFLNQESLPADAQLVFRAVLRQVRSNAAVFTRTARTAQRTEAWQAALDNGDVKVYKLDGGNGRSQWTLYVYTNEQTDESAQAADQAPGTTTDTTDTIPEDSVSN